MAASGQDADTGPDREPAAAAAPAVRRALHAWREWRRARPFWGGLFVVLGAGEILLSEQASFPLAIHIGLHGLASYLIPLLLLLCGLLLWFHPLLRTFYSVLAVLLALGSWITSNLGGFFVGMLLGLFGGSLAFAWVSGAASARSARSPSASSTRGLCRPNVAERQGDGCLRLVGRSQGGSSRMQALPRVDRVDVVSCRGKWSRRMATAAAARDSDRRDPQRRP
jgi:hypothetical protein